MGSPTGLAAQASGPCDAAPASQQNACALAADLFALVLPQVALGVAGGNPVLGDGSTLGGFGKAAVALRLTGERPPHPGALPAVSPGSPQALEVASQEAWLASVVAEGAVGVLPGVLVGLTRVGGIDLLLSVGTTPSVARDRLSLGSDGGRLALGVGVRLGVLQESSLVPGVAVTWQRREGPPVRTTWSGETGLDDLVVRDARARVEAWRVVVSRRAGPFGAAAGIGQDRVRSEARLAATGGDVGGGGFDDLPIGQSLVRTQAFGNASLGLGPVRAVLEAGRAGGAALPAPLHRFDGATPSDARWYGAAGVRVGF